MTPRLPDDSPADWIAGLYDRFAGALYRYATMILADPAGAADAVQQVFLALAAKSAGTIQDDERYLRRAVRNECYSALRRRRRELSIDAGVLLESVQAADDRPDERIAIDAALRTLPAEQREVLHMKVFEGMTFQEIAEHAGESINTVASRYRYALEKLRAQLVTKPKV